MPDAAHVSVLLEESVAALALKPEGTYVDATFGRGGHARAILARLSAAGRLVAIDFHAQLQAPILPVAGHLGKQLFVMHTMVMIAERRTQLLEQKLQNIETDAVVQRR